MSEQLTLPELSPRLDTAPPVVLLSRATASPWRTKAPTILAAVLGAALVGVGAWGYSVSQDLARSQTNARDLQAQLTATTASLTTTQDELTTTTQRATTAESQAALQGAAAQSAAQSARDCNLWISGLQFYVQDYSAVWDIWGQASKGGWSYAEFGQAVDRALSADANQTLPTNPTDAQKTSCRNYKSGTTTGS